jgi:hypothetical protein
MNVGFDFNSARRIARVVERVEKTPRELTDEGFVDTGNDGNFDDWVLTTSGSATGGWYPGKTQTFAESTGLWSDVDGSTVYIRGPNGETLSNATRYRGNIVDAHSGASAYQAVGIAGAAGSITVAEVDGSPSVSSVNTINFDQADGFTVTNSGGGVARIDMATATSALVGIISLSSQYLGRGTKTVDALRISANAPTPDNTADITLSMNSGTGLTAFSPDNNLQYFHARSTSPTGLAAVPKPSITFLTGGFVYSGQGYVVSIIGETGEVGKNVSIVISPTLTLRFKGGILVGVNS